MIKPTSVGLFIIIIARFRCRFLLTLMAGSCRTILHVNVDANDAGGRRWKILPIKTYHVTGEIVTRPVSQGRTAYKKGRARAILVSHESSI
jgi:hypothetical protein